MTLRALAIAAAASALAVVVTPLRCAGAVPPIHTRPGSANVVYVDFDGGTDVASGLRVSAYGGTAADQSAIVRAASAYYSSPVVRRPDGTLARMASLDVDFTTDPLAKAGGTVLVGETATGGAGSTQVVGGFGIAGINSSIVVPSGVGGTDQNIATAVAHELGHQFGLGEQFANGTYARGSNGVAPIMGYFYDGPPVWWVGASSFGPVQDDYAGIAARTGVVSPEPAGISLLVLAFACRRRRPARH